MMNSATAAANVGMNHLRSLGFKAGRKNARICQRMIGDVATTDIQNAILNLTVKGSSALMNWRSTAPLSPCGRNSAMGSSRNWPTVPAAR